MPFVRSLLQNLIRSYVHTRFPSQVLLWSSVVEVTINTFINIDALILSINVIVMFNFILFYVPRRLVWWLPFVRRWYWTYWITANETTKHIARGWTLLCNTFLYLLERGNVQLSTEVLLWYPYYSPTKSVFFISFFQILSSHPAF